MKKKKKSKKTKQKTTTKHLCTNIQIYFFYCILLFILHRICGCLCWMNSLRFVWSLFFISDFAGLHHKPTLTLTCKDKDYGSWFPWTESNRCLHVNIGLLFFHQWSNLKYKMPTNTWKKKEKKNHVCTSTNSELTHSNGSNKTQHTFGNGESWRPLWPQDVKTNAAIAVDIWVVDSCGKCNLKHVKNWLRFSYTENLGTNFCSRGIFFHVDDFLTFGGLKG